MKLMLAAVALTLATSAHAQVQTQCYNNGVNTVCRSYNTGAPQIPGSSSETIQYGGRTVQVQTYGQPVPPPQVTNQIDWGLAARGMAPLGNPIDALRPH